MKQKKTSKARPRPLDQDQLRAVRGGIEKVTWTWAGNSRDDDPPPPPSPQT